MKVKLVYITVVAILLGGLGQSAQAGLAFWQRSLLSGSGDYGTASNWSTGAVPGAGDLAVSNSSSNATIQVTSDQSADSLRLSDGGKVVQSAGTFTIETGIAGDNGLWVGEFGPGATSYTLNGGSIQINDAADGFMIGRAGGSNGTFTLNAGTVTNTAGDTHIGLDGTAVWNQSGGQFHGTGIQIGRFASPTATVNLSGNAEWNVGLVLLADGHGVFDPRNSGPVNFNLTGPDVSLSAVGLVAQDEANFTFDGTGGGISTFDLGNGQFLLNNGELFINNLPVANFGDVMVLFDNIGSFTGSDTEFDNAPNGTLYGDWILDYTSTQIRLVSTVAVPEPATAVFAGVALGGVLAIRRRRG